MLNCVSKSFRGLVCDNTVYLKDAYFHIEIQPEHTLRFAFSGEAYQYRALPSCLGLSPVHGCINVLNYIDDWLTLAQSKELATQY